MKQDIIINDIQKNGVESERETDALTRTNCYE